MKKYIKNIIEIIFTVSVIVGYINDINWLYYSGIVYYSILFLSSIFSLIVMGYYKFDYNILSQHVSKDLLDQIFDKSFNIEEFIDVLIILALSKDLLDQTFDKSFNIEEFIDVLMILAFAFYGAWMVANLMLGVTVINSTIFYLINKYK